MVIADSNYSKLGLAIAYRLRKAAGIGQMRIHSYWYLPEEEAEATNNDYKIRITIPKTNRLGVGFVRDRFEQLGIEL